MAMRVLTFIFVVGLLAGALSFVSVAVEEPAPTHDVITHPPATRKPPTPTPEPKHPSAKGSRGGKKKTSSHEAGTVPWATVTDAISGAFAQGTASRMIDVSDCETGGNGYQPALDIGDAGEVGPLQIHPGWWTKWPSRSAPLVQSMGYTRSDLFDPYVSAKVGARIFDEQGFGAWRNCL